MKLSIFFVAALSVFVAAHGPDDDDDMPKAAPKPASPTLAPKGIPKGSSPTLPAGGFKGIPSGFSLPPMPSGFTFPSGFPKPKGGAPPKAATPPKPVAGSMGGHSHGGRRL